ncbi:MAG: TonB-dependent receptor plug domain-containing protein [Sphingomonadaceae bacterium]
MHQLRALLLAGSAFAAPLLAQPAARAEAPADESETIVVTAPIRAAQARAIEEQRLADNLVAIVAADAIGRFPDQNSAAALARLPAVAVQRDQGQERYIQVRGAPNRWTSVSFDGVPVIGVDEGDATRAFRFDAIPSVILSSIAVNKSLTPDLPAEAIVAQDRPTTLDFRNYIVPRTNNGASAGVEVRPADGQKLFLKGVWSEFRDDEERNQYVFQVASAASGTRGVTSGDLVGVPVRGTLSYSAYRNRNWILTGGGDHALASDWSLSWRANYTRVENTTSIPLVLQNQQINRLNRPSLTYDRSNPNFPILQLFSTVPGLSPRDLETLRRRYLLR